MFFILPDNNRQVSQKLSSFAGEKCIPGVRCLQRTGDHYGLGLP